MSGGTYSFLDVSATLTGAGGSIALGAGAQVSQEGITVAYVDPSNTMTIGADGAGMHSLRATKAAKVTVRLLKTSPTNALLSTMFALQKASPAAWGANVLVIRDARRGDLYNGQQVAFTKFPDNAYAEQGNMLDWTFDVIQMEPALG